MSELVLICGWPGSGKSTRAKNEFPDHYLVEADMYFIKNGEYKFNAADLSKAHGWCRLTAKLLLKQGKKVVVANTFTRKWEREPYVVMANDMGVPVRILFCNGEYENVHGVPADVVDKMKARMEYS